jgi:uncharacterized secreted protein with C-terminal beta-propeller domain
MKRCLTLVALVLMVGVSGCGFDLWGWLTGTQGEDNVAELRQFASEAELKAYLTDQAQLQFQPMWSPEPSPEEDQDGAGGANGDEGVAAPTDPDTATGELGGDDSDRDHSTTTEQEEGVQEADVIKNDGDYIYVLSRGVLRIVSAVPAGGMAEVGSVELNGWGSELYLVGNRVVTITTPNAPVFVEDDGVAVTTPLVGPDYYYRPQTEISVIDVTDRTRPVVVSRAIMDGWINTSRMVENRLHLVAVNYPEMFVSRYGYEGDGGMNLADVPLTDLIPDIIVEENGVVVYNGDITDYSNHYRPADPDGLGLTTVLSLDIDGLRGFEAQTLVGYPANIYSSVDALYVTDTDYNSFGELRGTTDIYKFTYTDSGIELAAAGSVPGRVLNQYSMSEYQGFLRVATTIDRNQFGPRDDVAGDEVAGDEIGSTNNVYVLEQTGNTLSVVGRVEGLAPGETIYSARFMGDKGYLVTFEQIDPLFTLDMSDPRNPKAVGELKVPGFSTFIMPMGDDHLLTIGQDTATEFDWTYAEGVRLSIFDVSDFASPQLVHFEVIGTNGTYSEALYNPKALTYFASQGLLAIPIEHWAYDFGLVVDGGEGGFGELEPGDEGVADDGSAADDTEEGDAAGDDAGSDGAGGDDTGGDDTGGDEGDGAGVDGEEPLMTDDDPVGSDPVPGILPPVPSDYFSGLYVYRVSAEGGFQKLGQISTVNSSEVYYYVGNEFTRGVFIGETVYAVTANGVQAAAVADLATILSHVDFPLPEWATPVLPEPVEEPTEAEEKPAVDIDRM